MCGRFALSIPDLQTLAEVLEAGIFAEYEVESYTSKAGPIALTPETGPKTHVFRPRYNIAPQTLHFVLLLREGRRTLVPAVWGWDKLKDKLLINARAETVAEKPTFREAFQKRRCLIPADGFFEWLREGKDRRPFWFPHAEGKLLLMAGIFEIDEAGTFTYLILTTEANALVATVHSRMPVFIPPEKAMEWLEQPDLGLLRPAPSELLRKIEVSKTVNSVKNDGPECIQEVPAAGSRIRQPTLF